MKKILTIMISTALVAGVTSALAQGAGPKPGQGGKAGQAAKPGQPGQGGGMRRMGGGGTGMLLRDENAKKLGLTEAQKTKIKAIGEETQKALKPIMPDRAKLQGKSREEMMAEFQKVQAKMKPITDAAMKKINAVLTPAQQKQFAEMQKEMQKRRASFGGPGGAVGKGGTAAKGGASGKGGKGGL